MIPPVGTRVTWKQPTEGHISEVTPHYFCVKFDGDTEWSFENEQIQEFEVRYPEPEAGEVWEHTDGTRGFLFFNSADRLTMVTRHGRFVHIDMVTVANGWSKVS